MTQERGRGVWRPKEGYNKLIYWHWDKEEILLNSILERGQGPYGENMEV
jgi:hypothetical protein